MQTKILQNYLNFRGVSQLMKWEDLPQILQQDRRQIKETPGKGFVLLESIQTCLAEDYDIFMTLDQIIDKAAEELVKNPEYMKYYKAPLSQADVHAAVKLGTSTRNYGRLVTDTYIPALSTSLQLHFRVLTNVHGYYALMHTTPMGCNEDPKNPWKVINLILTDEEKYQPVIFINENNMEPTTDKAKSQFSLFPDVMIVEETQKESTPIEPPANEPQQVVLVTGSDVTTTEPPSLLQEQEQSPLVGTATEQECVVSPIQIPSQPKQVDEHDSSIADSVTTIPETQLCGAVTDSQSNPLDEPDVPSQITTPAKTNGDNIQPITEQNNLVLGSGRYFSMEPFRKMIPEVVDRLPHKINGRKFYMLDVDENDKYTDKYKDGRYFSMHSSKRKGFRGVRKVGKCKGNYKCNNDSCPFYLVEGKRNCHQFNNICGKKFCFSCESWPLDKSVVH